MSNFAFNVKVNDPFADITEAALGASTGEGWGDEEVGKAVKLGPANNYVLASDGDDIEGVLVSVEPNTVNQGFSFGSVQRNCRREAVLDTLETGVAVGATVVAGAQEAVGTQTNGNKTVVATGAGVVYKWRVIRLIDGTGEAGDTVLIEKV
jgi:hypothetical protein